MLSLEALPRQLSWAEPHTASPFGEPACPGAGCLDPTGFWSPREL